MQADYNNSTQNAAAARGGRQNAKELNKGSLVIYLFRHVLIMPFMRLIYYLPGGIINFSETSLFSIIYWFSGCALVILLSLIKMKKIRDSGLRTFYIFAMISIPLTLAFSLTGIL